MKTKRNRILKNVPALAALGLLGTGVVFWQQKNLPNTPGDSRAIVDDSCCTGRAMASDEQVEIPVALQQLAGKLNAKNIELQRFTLPSQLAETLNYPLLLRGAQHQVELRKRTVRSENFKLLRQHADGTFENLEAPEVGTYSGTLGKDDQTEAYVTFTVDGIRARIVKPDGSSLLIDPVPPDDLDSVAQIAPDGAGALHAVYEAHLPALKKQGLDSSNLLADARLKLQTRAGTPGVDVAEQGAGGAGNDFPIAAAPGAGPTIRQCELGFDVAYSFYRDWGKNSATTTTGVLEAWLNNEENPVMINGPLVEVLMGTVVLRTTAATDPYNGNGDAYSLLPKVKGIWNGSDGAWPRPSTTHDIATGVYDQGIGVTGLASVGVVGTGNKYSVCTSSSGLGYWKSGLRHEVGHNFSLGHGNGCGEQTQWFDVMGLMCGGYHERCNSVEMSKMLSHRNSRAAGVLVDIGPLPAARRMKPYCTQDVSYTAAASGPSITLDVLKNDHDANADTFIISHLEKDNPSNRIAQEPPIAVTTKLGGTMIRSIGTGSGGRDQIIYTPPSGQTGGIDDFHYHAKDSTGQINWGYVKITVGDPPPDPYGEITRSGQRSDSVLDWTFVTDGSVPSTWDPGFYAPDGSFIALTTLAQSDLWRGGDGSVIDYEGTDPRIGLYSLESDVVRPAIRRWTADTTANIAVDYDVHRIRSGGDGCTVSIQHNRTSTLWTQAMDNTNLHFTGTVYVQVKPGDTIDLVQTSGQDEGDDVCHFTGRVYERHHVREETVLPSFHYKMDEGVLMPSGTGGDYDRRLWMSDSSTKNRSAKLSNANLTLDWRAGIMGNALDLDGTDSFAQTLESGIGDGAAELTLSVWIQPDAKADNVTPLSVNAASTDFCAILLSGYGAGNPVEFRCKGSRVTAPDNSGPVGRWTHVAGVWKAGTFQKLYLNGVEVGSITSGVPGGTLNVDKWYFGRDRDFTDRYYTGKVDDAALWKRAFTPTEIQALHEQGRSYHEFDGTSTTTPFVGVDSYLPAATSEVTVGAWVNVTTPGDRDGVFTCGATGSQFLGLRLQHNATAAPPAPAALNSINFSILDSSTYLFAPENSVPPNEWVHVVGTWKSGQFQRLYINGVLAASHATPYAGNALPTAWTTGRHQADNSRLLAGKVSDTVVMGRALTDAEVLDLFNTGRTAWDASHGLLVGTAPIGTLSLPGDFREGGGEYLLSASGSGLGTTSDSFQWSRINHLGNGEVTVRLDSLENTAPGAMAGLMLRQSTDAAAPFIYAAMRGDRQVALLQRTTASAAMTPLTNWQAAPPNAVWLRLLRTDDTVAARLSSDGETWTTLGLYRGGFPSTSLFGIASTSGTQAALSTAVVGAISASPNIETDLDSDQLPDAFEKLTFGTTAVTQGSADSDGDGQNNFLEYLAGTDPRTAAQFFRGALLPASNGRYQLTWPTATGRRYSVFSSPSLVGSWALEAEDVLGGQLLVTPGPGRMFYRVEVSF
jgi:hypothetical protein